MKSESTNVSPTRQMSAWLPLTMSLAALTLVLGQAAIFGVVHEADEGTAAHVWQILMAAQLPLVAYFILKWLPRRPRESFHVLVLLVGTWLANFAAVYWFTSYLVRLLRGGRCLLRHLVSYTTTASGFKLISLGSHMFRSKIGNHNQLRMELSL